LLKKEMSMKQSGSSSTLSSKLLPIQTQVKSTWTSSQLVKSRLHKRDSNRFVTSLEAFRLITRTKLADTD